MMVKLSVIAVSLHWPMFCWKLRDISEHLTNLGLSSVTLVCFSERIVKAHQSASFACLGEVFIQLIEHCQACGNIATRCA